jgi:site-specific recombinase XerD
VSVYERNGTWYYDFRLFGRRHFARVSHRKTDAINAERVARGRLLDTRLQDRWGIGPARKAAPTVQEFYVKTFLPHLKASHPGTTTITYQTALNAFARAFGTAKLAEITPAMLDTFKVQRLETLRGNTVAKELRQISALFDYAVELNVVATNPVAKVRKPKITQRIYRLLHPTERDAFFNAIHHPNARALLEFIFLMGLRSGEGIRLRASQIDLTRKVAVWVQPKTGRRKELPLSGRALEIAKTFVRPGADPDAFVFTTHVGKPFSISGLRQHLVRASKRIGITGLRVHDLRHSAAMRLLEAGADTATVGMFLGHTPPYHATAVYTQHSTPDRLRKALQVIHHRPESQRISQPGRRGSQRSRALTGQTH